MKKRCPSEFPPLHPSPHSPLIKSNFLQALALKIIMKQPKLVFLLRLINSNYCPSTGSRISKFNSIITPHSQTQDLPLGFDRLQILQYTVKTNWENVCLLELFLLPLNSSVLCVFSKEKDDSTVVSCFALFLLYHFKSTDFIYYRN